MRYYWSFVALDYPCLAFCAIVIGETLLERGIVRALCWGQYKARTPSGEEAY